MKLVLATRKSPLALVQTEMVAARFREKLPGVECELLKVVTTGDQKLEWSLAEKGGKGLFTAELEQALLRGDADVAVHSCKDLPGQNPPGLAMAGYMPREDTRDVLVMRESVASPFTIASASPRRRLQLARLFPLAKFSEIRGNVDTRLKKIAEGQADATMLAAAGLNRLGIKNWPGLTFRALAHDECVPAVGQGAIAVQCREADVSRFSPALEASVTRSVGFERIFQSLLGGGCQIAFGAHVTDDRLYFFHENTGIHTIQLTATDFADPLRSASRILQELGFNV
jgi:hydroxymethylbilane synthase